jgi:hypothetical protein
MRRLRWRMQGNTCRIGRQRWFVSYRSQLNKWTPLRTSWHQPISRLHLLLHLYVLGFQPRFPRLPLCSRFVVEMSMSLLPGASEPDINKGPQILGACGAVTTLALISVCSRIFVRVRMVNNPGPDVRVSPCGSFKYSC